MARELADVIHYFLEDREPGDEGTGAAPRAPLIAVPVSEKDVIRVAFVWNLAVELARSGARPLVLAPDDASLEPLRECLPAPVAEPDRVGPEFAFSGAHELAPLGRDARDLARARRPGAGPGFALLPSRWIAAGDDAGGLLGTPLLFTTPVPADLDAAYALAERIFEVAPDARLGVTIHGVGSVDEACRAFEGMAERVAGGLDRTLISYGLLLEDLQIYRALVNRRAVGLAQPQSLAARALADVARLLREDAGARGAGP